MRSRTKADALIHGYKEIYGEGAVEMAFDEALENNNQRTMQYIMVDGKVEAVATTKHLLIPAEEVMEIARRVSPSLQPQENYTGLLQELDVELPGVKVSWQIDPGDILTRRAIRMGTALRVISCFNPLTFVGSGGFDRFFGEYGGRVASHEKILRVEHKVDLEERIKEALTGSESSVESLKAEIENAKKVQVGLWDAKVLLTAFPVAFSAGKKTVRQIVKRYKSEDQTLWGLAQAASYVARYGEFRGNAKVMDRKLAVVGAAYFNISDVKGVADNCRKWLKMKGIKINDWL